MKNHTEILEALKEELKNHSVSIKEYENQIFPKIVKFEWATEPQVHLELLKIERARLPKGKIYTEKNDNTPIKLGYDIQDRIIFEEEEEKYRMFISYKDNSVWGYKFSDGKIDRIEYQTLEKGIPKTFASYEEGVVNTVDKYEYLNERLVKINSYSSYEAFGYSPQMPNYHVAYNKLGDISEIKRKDEPSDFFPNGQDLIIYKKHNYSIKALTEILISELVELIKQDLQNQNFNQKKLLLIFISNSFNSDDWFPPRFSIIKPKNLMKLDVTIDELIDLNLVFTDYPVSDKLVESSNLLMQEIELKEKYETPYKILIKAAKEIKSWWSKSNEKNDNLIILPLDFPDDYYESILSALQRIYSNNEIKKIEITDANNG
jgi:hypothetical protein